MESLHPTELPNKPEEVPEEVKNLLQSKTFWFNALTLIAEVTQVLPLPPGTVAIISSVVNIGLRILTSEPVRVLPNKPIIK